MSDDPSAASDASSTSMDVDLVVEAYKKDVDITLIRENLKLTVDERLNKLFALQQFAEELRRAGRELHCDKDLP